MIKVTRLNGEELFLNYFQIEYLESIPETKIKMMTDKKDIKKANRSRV